MIMLVNINMVMVYEVSCAFVCVLTGDLIQVLHIPGRSSTTELYPWLSCALF